MLRTGAFCSAAGGTAGSVALAAHYGGGGLIVGAVATTAATIAAAFIPELFWLRALDPTRPLRWFARRNLLSRPVDPTELLDSVSKAHRQAVQARTKKR
ncbi:hypothetical protein AS200_09385 [Streptomyces sp. CdTB01]|nr:hypothetical protein AS200_09385 [Streptomyces sp. CdTB01]